MTNSTAVAERQAATDTPGEVCPGVIGWGTYPLPIEDAASDTRINLDLLVDIVQVLTNHGFPEPTTQWDLSRLMQSLTGFAYNIPHRPGVPELGQ